MHVSTQSRPVTSPAKPNKLKPELVTPYRDLPRTLARMLQHRCTVDAPALTFRRSFDRLDTHPCSSYYQLPVFPDACLDACSDACSDARSDTCSDARTLARIGRSSSLRDSDGPLADESRSNTHLGQMYMHVLYRRYTCRNSYTGLRTHSPGYSHDIDRGKYESTYYLTPSPSRQAPHSPPRGDRGAIANKRAPILSHPIPTGPPTPPQGGSHNPEGGTGATPRQGGGGRKPT